MNAPFVEAMGVLEYLLLVRDGVVSNVQIIVLGKTS
jgi:hypothetical protein